MKTRTLGKTGLELSEVGLGCWQFGGDFGPTKDETSKETMTAAVNNGVSFFDTADVYGAGRSESVIGEFIAETDNKSVIATKVGRTAELYPDGYTCAKIASHLKSSAQRLKTDALDLVQLHCVPTEILDDGQIFKDMDLMVADGLCKNWGASVETIAEAEISLQQENLGSLQIIFNIFRQDAAWDLLEKARANNVGVIVRLPLASGLLTGKFSANTKFAETDHRNFNADGQAFSVGETLSGLTLSKGVELVAELENIKPENISLADMSLRWILDHPAVTSVIAGVSKPSQVAANAKASSLPPLSKELHEQLTKFYKDKVRSHIRSSI